MSAVRPEQSLIASEAERPEAEQPAGLEVNVCEVTGAAVVDVGAVQVTDRVGVPELLVMVAVTPVGAAGASIGVLTVLMERGLSPLELYDEIAKSYMLPEVSPVTVIGDVLPAAPRVLVTKPVFE